MSGEPEVLRWTFRTLAGHFSAKNDRQTEVPSLDIFNCVSPDIRSFFPRRTFCPAIWELFAGHFQNSPDMSGVSSEFREAWLFKPKYILNDKYQ